MRGRNRYLFTLISEVSLGAFTKWRCTVDNDFAVGQVLGVAVFDSGLGFDPGHFSWARTWGNDNRSTVRLTTAFPDGLGMSHNRCNRSTDVHTWGTLDMHSSQYVEV